MNGDQRLGSNKIPGNELVLLVFWVVTSRGLVSEEHNSSIFKRPKWTSSPLWEAQISHVSILTPGGEMWVIKGNDELSNEVSEERTPWNSRRYSWLHLDTDFPLICSLLVHAAGTRRPQYKAKSARHYGRLFVLPTVKASLPQKCYWMLKKRVFIYTKEKIVMGNKFNILANFEI